MSQQQRSPETRPSLILRIRNREDMRAWEEFVEIYQPLIYSIALKRGLQRVDAEDVAQEVLTNVARHLEKWKPTGNGSFRAWLATITKNETLLFFRKSGRRPSVGLDSSVGGLATEFQDQDYDFEHDRHVFAWACRQIQNRFDQKNWQAFWQTTVVGNSIENVAKKSGMSKAQVYVARSRIMSALKRTVENSEFDTRTDWRNQ